MTKNQFSVAILTSVCSMMNFSSSLQAASVTGDCAALGYTKAENTCEGDIIRCPFDTNKVFCKEKTCTSNTCSGYTLNSCPSYSYCSYCNIINSDCSKGGTKYKVTSCAPGYNMINNSCVKAGVSRECLYVGDILYHDKTCAGVNDTLDTSKTVIGVVYDIEQKLAVALKQSSQLEWGAKTDIWAIQNRTNPNEAKNDHEGKYNTNYLIITGSNSNGNYKFPAADYANNYITVGTKQGNWYLPAGSDLYTLKNNADTLNNSLSKVGGTPLSNDIYYWSSSELDKDLAWVLRFSNGIFSTSEKDTKNYVRPVIAFEKIS